jgi:hypothetical protein
MEGIDLYCYFVVMIMSFVTTQMELELMIETTQLPKALACGLRKDKQPALAK